MDQREGPYTVYWRQDRWMKMVRKARTAAIHSTHWECNLHRSPKIFVSWVAWIPLFTEPMANLFERHCTRVKIASPQSWDWPSHTPTPTTHNFVDVINLHLQWNLEVIWVLKNRSHESQFFGPRSISFYLGQKYCGLRLLFLSTHITSKLRWWWRLITSTK